MPRIAYVILCSCLLVITGFIASAANAGGRDDGYRDVGYRDGGYYVDVAAPPRRPHRVWYSSTCCYRKIVRHVGHVRQVRYVRVASAPPPIVEPPVKHHYYGPVPRPRPHEQIGHTDVGRHAAKYEVIVVKRDAERDRRPCRHKRVRVLSGDGGSVWALSAACD